MTTTIVVVGIGGHQRERVAQALAPDHTVEDAPPGGVLTGAALVITTAADLASLPEAAGVPVVVVGEWTAALPARVAYVVGPDLPVDQLRLVLGSLAVGHPAVAAATLAAPTAADAQHVQRAFALSRRLAAAGDLAAVEQVATAAIVELVGADRAACRFFDGTDGTLWTDETQGVEPPAGDPGRAVTGVVGFVARTGQTVRVACLRDDGRHHVALDSPGGDPRDRLLAVPVHGGDGQVHAILVAARTWRREPFTAADAAVATTFASLCGPFLTQLAAQLETKARLEPADDGLFRREAIEAQALPPWGDVIRVTPSWLGWAFWLLVALLATSVAYLAIGTISTYSSGPAIVRASSRADVSAVASGVVAAVVVRAGDLVRPGDEIARLDDAEQRGVLERIEREFDTQLRNHMADPADAAADAALRALRLELDRALLAADARVVRAPSAGTIADVRARPGLRVGPGDVIATVADGSRGLELVALLPGSLRPQLAAGMPVRFELQGYRYAYLTVVIADVSADVIAPSEARRVLGADVADGVRVAGPVVVVRGHLADDRFAMDGRTYHVHDGMLGAVDVRVRRERIIYALVPGLRGLW